ncbi:unnamed protein product [Arabidopsis lyrata]|uniref:uncharacterized protein LOC9322764 n=1 Tax=Arabidopsis lyrata subsp. lyrata TaxID=81972 RepID=UPI000A29EA3E|nr:uncharacterized protein LOC9322764 [Arabidopsis lyrata subsp. lyrata]CAH8256521.1 unnamed protein product [Arabidopsis lyrata]|eukprot:XP_020891093.1 uncharacterized protein LOC9322764 [Arabidopsis lyrata subsp. lyrata]
MDIDKMEGNNQVEQHHVDTSRPFSSVKEAVAIFGQRIMLPVQTHTLNSKPVSPIANRSISQTDKPRSPIASPGLSQTAKLVSPTASPKISQTAKLVSPIASPNISQTASSSSPWKQRSLLPSSPQGPKDEIMDVLKKLEAEITETKTEVKMLKERESETEVALATLNAELHKNMSKIAKAEADAAGKSAAAMEKSVRFKDTQEKENREDQRRKELMRKMQKEYPSLAQILDSNKGDKDGYFAKTKKTKKKKKPIIPLVGDFFFFRKKGPATEISGPLYTTSSTLHF